MVHHAGACGCGRVEVHFVTALAPEQLQPRTDAATCRFCAAHDGVWISDPQGALRVRAADVTRVRTFAAGEVRFHFCEECDELVYATFSAGGREVGVVRLGVLPTIRRAAPPPATTDFEGETVEVARRRRLANWTPLERA